MKWSHVPKLYFRGNPIGYNIIYYPADLKRNFKFVSANYTTNTTTLTDLAVQTVYIITVSAVSSGGVGPAQMTMARTYAEGKEIFKNSV